MNASDPYEQWTRARSRPEVDPAFADRVMEAVRQSASRRRPVAVGGLTIAAALVAGGVLALVRAACLLAVLLGPTS